MLKSKVSGLPGNWGAWVRLQFQWPCSLLWIPHHGLLGGQEQSVPAVSRAPAAGRQWLHAPESIQEQSL